MKSWEMEEWIKQQAYKEGHDEGYSVGHDEGRREGHSEGHSKGHREGIEKANRLYATLAEAGRMDDIVKAAGDREYQEKLFREFNL